MRTQSPARRVPAGFPDNGELVRQCSDLAFRLSGLVSFYRDITEAMAACTGDEAEFILAERDAWVVKLDVLNNIATEASDGFNDALRACGLPAALNLEVQVHRSFSEL